LPNNIYFRQDGIYDKKQRSTVKMQLRKTQTQKPIKRYKQTLVQKVDTKHIVKCSMVQKVCHRESFCHVNK